MKELTETPELLESLRDNSAYLNAQLKKVPGIKMKGGDQDFLPVKHVCLEDSAHEFDREEQKLIILQIAKRVTELGTGISACKASVSDLVPSLAPSLRICATSYMTEAQIKQACKDLKTAVNETLEKAVKVRTRTESGAVDITIGSPKKNKLFRR